MGETDVRNQLHYTMCDGPEPIDVMAEHMGDNFYVYCTGNVYKYCRRYKYKNGNEDLRKALTYIEFMLNYNDGLDVKSTKYIRDWGVSPAPFPLEHYLLCLMKPNKYKKQIRQYLYGAGRRIFDLLEDMD